MKTGINKDIDQPQAVRFFDLSDQFQKIHDELMEAASRVFKHCHFVLGPEVEELERRVSTLCGTRHGIGVASGSDALIIALIALDVQPGDEVITTAFSFFSTASYIARLGATPVFVDIEPDGFSIDPDKLEALLEEKYEPSEHGAVNKDTGKVAKAVLPVHLFGQCSMVNRETSFITRFNLKVVEDACQAIAATTTSMDGTEKPAGSLGDVACFSFYPTKNLGGVGDAGMIVTGDDAIFERSLRLRNHGYISPADNYPEMGFNSRLDSLQAAALLVKLKYLNDFNRLRRERAALYDKILGNNISPETGFVKAPVTLSGNHHTYHQYTLRCKNRNELKSWLASKGINTQTYYSAPLHLLEAFSYLRYIKGDMPQAEAASEEVLSLPIYPELSLGDIERVAVNIVSFYDLRA